MQNKIITLYKLCSLTLLTMCFIFSATFFLASCHTSTTDQYGFITKLGNDTIAVERISREGNTETSDEVDRFPRVHVRHTVTDLNNDGSIRHLVMDIHTLSQQPKERTCKVVVDVINNVAHISKKDSTGTLKLAFSTSGSIVVAHVPQMYSLYELYFAAALKQAAALKLAPGSTIQMRQVYIDREFDHFPLGHASVQVFGNGKADVTHDWLSGTGEATMDSNYHMLSYSGNRTTYKVEVNRLTSPPDVKSMADRFEALETKNGAVKQLSVRDSVHAQVGNAMFSIDYARPLMRGRTLLGDVIPYDRVWRTGANAATQFSTSAPIKIGDLQVPAGAYTLWTVPHTSGVDLIVNKQTGQWGTEYNGSQNLGITKMTAEVPPSLVEEFTINIVSTDARHGMLVMEWGNFKWTAPIIVQ